MTENIADNPHTPGTVPWHRWNRMWISAESARRKATAGSTLDTARVTAVPGGHVVAHPELAASRPDPVIELLGGYTFTTPPTPTFADADQVLDPVAVERAVAAVNGLAEALSTFADAFLTGLAEGLAAFADACATSLPSLIPPTTTTSVVPRNAGLVTCPKHGRQDVSFCRPCQRGH